MRIKALLVSIVVCASIAIYFQIVDHEYFGLFKALTTTQVILMPIFFAAGVNHIFRRIVILGLIFCLLGDILLLQDFRFVQGLIAFLFGHLLFCYAFYYQNKNKLKAISLIILLIIGAIYYFYLFSSLNDLAIPVAIYILVIVTMSWLAVELYWRDKSVANLTVAVGAILFLLSDATLAWNKFVATFDYSSLAILATYWLAITLFAYSTVLSKNLVKK